MKKIETKNLWWILIGIFGLIFGFLLLKHAFSYFLPFVIALLVALLIEPLVAFIQKKIRLSRGLSVAVVMGLILLIFAVFIIAGVSQIYFELEKLSHNLPSYQVIFERYQWILNQNGELKNLMNRWQLSLEQQAVVNKFLEDLYRFFTDNFKAIIGELLALIARLPSVVTIFLISFIATFFISRDRRMLGDLFWKIVPEELQAKLSTVKDEIFHGAVGFIRAQLILISITTIIAIMGMEILNNDYALIIGFSSGLLDLIPIIGPALIFIPWALYSIILGEIYYGLGLLIIYGTISVVRQLAEVKIVGQSIGVHPLATMTAMYIGVKALGITGFFLGPALVIVIKALISSGIILKKISK